MLLPLPPSPLLAQANFLLLLRRLLWKSSRVSPEQSSDPDAQILLNLQQDAASTCSPWEGLTFNSLCPKMAPAHASFKQVAKRWALVRDCPPVRQQLALLL